MMRRQGKAALPLVVLLGFEVAAIVGLQSLGSAHSMQIPWGDISTWLSTSSIEDLAAPILRLFALGIAYWMFVTTALCVIAQVSRVPAAIRATSMFTLPSVRRVVDGAMVMSIATTSFVGVGGSAAFAADATTSTDITTSIGATSGDLSVPTPTVGGGGAADVTTTTGDVTTTTAATSSTVDNTSISATPGQDWVPTPVPSAAGPSSTTTSTAPITTTTVPQGPSTPADGNVSTPTVEPGVTTPSPEPSSTPDTQVLAASEHRVAPGENLWTISRDQVAEATGRQASQVSENEVRDYWLQVIDANRDTLRSKDPHWIFPGEVITLPSLDTSSAGS